MAKSLGKARRTAERSDARYMRLLREHGLRPPQIARRCGVSIRTVYNGLEREREREAVARRVAASNVREPAVMLAFGSSCKPLAILECGDVHRGPIPDGSRVCCAACHATGIDGHPSLRIDAMPPREKRVEPRAEPMPDRRRKRAAKPALANVGAQTPGAA